MKILSFFMVIFCSGLFQIAYTQETSFDTELSVLRKNIFSMCTQLQAGKPKESQEQLLNDIDSIINNWMEMKKKYRDNIPAEYSKDPEWRNYFDEVEDNFLIMRQKVEQQKYKRASQFCGQNCALFVKIHNINGKVTLTDKMFIIRQNIRTAVSMAKADNWKDAKNTIEQNGNILKRLKELYPANKSEEFKSDLKILLNIDKELKNMIKERDVNKLNEQFKSMLEKFNKIYFKYL